MAESVIRMTHRRGFTVVGNAMLRDPRLSLKTKGLFAVMLSKPGNWEFSISGLAAEAGTGKDAIRTSLKELEQAGYLTREKQSHGERGKFAGSVYILQEDSISPLSDYPTTVEPTTVDPMSAEPMSGNPTEINTDLSKDGNIPPIVPPGGRRKRKREYKEAPDWKPERFAKFWAFYPRGEDKQAAIRAWDRLQPDDALIDTIARALVRQMQSEDWSKGIGIPYASTYLNGRRWTDRPGKPPAGPLPDKSREVRQEWT